MEATGEPISRITAQPLNMNAVVRRELDMGLRNPEGLWGWLIRKRQELNEFGSAPTNREFRNLF